MKDERRGIFVALSFVSFVGSTLVGCLALGFFAGRWVDDKFATYPGGLAVCLLLSVLLAGRAIYLQLRDNFIRADKGSGR